MNAFAMKKPKTWRKKKDNESNEEEDMVMPEIYFTISFSSDKDPHKILDRVAGEWGKVGGKKLYLKSIASFNTMPVINIFHLRSNNTPETILAEFERILAEAKDITEREDADGVMQFVGKEIPRMNVRRLMPNIVGQDTKMFQGWSGRQHEMRKTITI